MCRTIKESINAFVISLFVARILYFADYKGKYSNLQKTNAILLLSFCFIQLADAAIHYFINSDNSGGNLFVSRYIIPAILMLEIPIMYYATYNLTKKRSIVFELIVFVLCIYGFISFVYSCNKPSVRGEDGFLIWCDNPIKSNIWKILFFFGILGGTFYYPLNVYKIVFYLVVTLTFLRTYNSDTFGSGWCHYANALSVIWLILFIIEKYNIGNLTKYIY